MGAIASQISSLTIVYSIVYSDADQRKHQSSASLVFVRGIHRSTVNSPHKWPVTRKVFPFDDVIMRDGLVLQPLHLSYTLLIYAHFCTNYWTDWLQTLVDAFIMESPKLINFLPCFVNTHFHAIESFRMIPLWTVQHFEEFVLKFCFDKMPPWLCNKASIHHLFVEYGCSQFACRCAIHHCSHGLPTG